MKNLIKNMIYYIYNLILIFSLLFSLINAFRINSYISSRTSYPDTYLVEVYSSRRNENSWNVPVYDVGSASELKTNCELGNTVYEHLLSSDDMINTRSYYDSKVKRYCYFDRGLACSSMTGECRIDSRPCTSDRSYLDHMYGSHNFPTIAKIAATSNSNLNNHNNNHNSNGLSSPRNVDINQPFLSSSSSHQQQRPIAGIQQNHGDHNGNSHNGRIITSSGTGRGTGSSHGFGSRGNSHVHDAKRATLVAITLTWIEQSIVTTVRFIFRIASTLITYIFSKPFESNDKSKSMNSKSNQNQM